MNHFFAKDGSFGNAQDILIVDTSSWGEDDFYALEDAHEYERLEVARKIATTKQSHVRLLGL
jgi:hypothetical protein